MRVLMSNTLPIALYGLVALCCAWRWLPAIHRMSVENAEEWGDSFGPRGDRVYSLLLAILAGCLWPVRLFYLLLAWIAQAAMRCGR